MTTKERKQIEKELSDALDDMPIFEIDPTCEEDGYYVDKQENGRYRVIVQTNEEFFIDTKEEMIKWMVEQKHY